MKKLTAISLVLILITSILTGCRAPMDDNNTNTSNSTTMPSETILPTNSSEPTNTTNKPDVTIPTVTDPTKK